MKETSLKHYILYDSNYMPLWKRQNYRNNESISVSQQLGGCMNGWSAEDFFVQWNSSVGHKGT